MAFHKNPRVTFTVAIAGLLVAYVRRVLQDHRYSWDTIFDFLFWWFIHYLAVMITVGLVYAVTRGDKSFLLGPNENLRKLSLEEAMIYGCQVIIISAIIIFVIAHWSPTTIET